MVTVSGAPPAGRSVEALLARGGSFRLPVRLAPTRARPALEALYAVCRDLDDLADGPAPAARKQAGLDAWRAAIDAWPDAPGAPPSLAALAARGGAARIDPGDLKRLLDALGADVAGAMRAPARAALERYIDGVACAPGRMILALLDEPGERARPVAEAMGGALQRVNILRDVACDAAEGRIYLPRETLSAAGLDAPAPETLLSRPELPGAIADFAAETRARLDGAGAALERHRLAFGARRVVMPMLTVYDALFDLLARGGFWPSQPPRRLGAARRLAAVAGGLIRAMA